MSGMPDTTCDPLAAQRGQEGPWLAGLPAAQRWGPPACALLRPSLARADLHLLGGAVVLYLLQRHFIAGMFEGAVRE